MGLELARRFPVVRSTLDRCDALARSEFSISLLEEIESGNRLKETEIAQPAIVAVEIAIYELWRSLGVIPAAVAGHSVGELSAAYAAGAFSLEETLRIAFRRGAVMRPAAGRGDMLAVGLSRSDAEALVAGLGHAGSVTVAAVNSPTSVVLAGRQETLAELAAACGVRNVTSHELHVGYAFHSPQMASIGDDLVAELRGSSQRRCAFPSSRP